MALVQNGAVGIRWSKLKPAASGPNTAIRLCSAVFTPARRPCSRGSTRFAISVPIVDQMNPTIALSSMVIGKSIHNWLAAQITNRVTLTPPRLKMDIAFSPKRFTMRGTNTPCITAVTSPVVTNSTPISHACAPN